jgi:hypothetical protein
MAGAVLRNIPSTVAPPHPNRDLTGVHSSARCVTLSCSGGDASLHFESLKQVRLVGRVGLDFHLTPGSPVYNRGR